MLEGVVMRSTSLWLWEATQYVLSARLVSQILSWDQAVVPNAWIPARSCKPPSSSGSSL